MKAFLRRLVFVSSLFGPFLIVPGLAQAACVVVTETVEQAVKQDDAGELRKVRMAEIRIVGDLAFEDALAAGRFEAERVAGERGADHVDIWIFENEADYSASDHAVYISYAPDPSKLVFRDAQWEGREMKETYGLKAIDAAMMAAVAPDGSCRR